MAADVLRPTQGIPLRGDAAHILVKNVEGDECVEFAECFLVVMRAAASL